MKIGARFSALVAFAALLSLPPCVAQSTHNASRTSTRNAVLNSAPSAFLTLALDHRARGNSGNDGNGGWGNGGGNNGGDGWGNGGGGGWGNGGGGNGGGWGNGGGGGTPVPEGGTNLMYLSLAALSCVAAMVFRSRQQTRVPETK